MTNRIILHIGPTKTGTKALQNFFVQNRSVLHENNIGYYLPGSLYNPWGSYANAAFLMRAALDRLGIATGEGEFWTKDNLHRDLESFVDYCNRYSTQILSEEILWNQGIETNMFWGNLRDTIREYCGKDVTIDVITYLRRQDERIVADWKENIRGISDDTEDFPTMMERIISKGLMDYDRALAALADSFGKEHIIVRSYNEAVASRGIIRDFLECTGISGLKESELKLEDRIVNPSFSLSMTEAYRLIKAGIVECNARLGLVRYAAYQIFNKEESKPKEYPLPYEERCELLRHFKKGNCRVAEEFLDGKALFSDEIEDYDPWEPNSERDRQNARAIARLAEYFESKSVPYSSRSI